MKRRVVPVSSDLLRCFLLGHFDAKRMTSSAPDDIEVVSVYQINSAVFGFVVQSDEFEDVEVAECADLPFLEILLTESEQPNVATQ